MSKFSRALVLGALLTVGAAAPAASQSGIALKAGYLFNHGQVEGTSEVSGVKGLGAGVEYVLPSVGVGVGVSAYTLGRWSDFDLETSDVNVVAEANYFFQLPFLPVTPYAGVHAGMGQYSRTREVNPSTRLQDNWRQLGYQAGVRLQLISLLGVDAQFRRVSSSLADSQDQSFSRNQVLVGITLF